MSSDFDFSRFDGEDQPIPEPERLNSSIYSREKAIGTLVFISGGLSIIAAFKSDWNPIIEGFTALPGVGAALLGGLMARGHIQLFPKDLNRGQQDPPEYL